MDTKGQDEVRVDRDVEVRREDERIVIINYWTEEKVSFDFTLIPKMQDALMRLYAGIVQLDK